METAVDAIITIDEAGRIESANPATEALFGYSAAELLGNSVNMLMAGGDASAHDRHMARYRGGGEAHIIGIGREVTARRKDGSTFPVHLAVGEMTEGGRRMFTGMMRDLSDLRRAEGEAARQRAKAHEELRLREAEQRHSEALLAAEREARRVKDEFLAMISHELRTPLTAVLGYLELAIADVADPGVRELLEVAERNGRRMHALVRDVLLLARAGAGRLELEVRSVELGELVRQALIAARPAAAAKGVALEDEILADATVQADPARIAQVLDNLISNAIKFSPDGGSVRVGLRTRSARARITVADEGPGIPADQRVQLFEAFYRAPQAARDQVPGTGLGLAVVKAIAEAHGGTVGLASGAGRGCVFHADIPLAASDETALSGAQ